LSARDRLGRRAFVAYGVLQALALASFFFVPVGTRAHSIWMLAVGYGGAAAVFAGLRVRRGLSTRAWSLFGVALLCNTTGTLLESLSDIFPQFAGNATVCDLFWLALYPAVSIGLAIVIRRRGTHRDWTSPVEALIITAGVGLLAWVEVIGPAAVDPSHGLLARATGAAYPVGDLALLAMTLRVGLGGGTRNGAFRLIALSFASFLVADVGWAAVQRIEIMNPSVALQRSLEVSSMAGQAFLGAAALHPSAANLAVRGSLRTAVISPRLLVGLAAALLIPSAVLAYEARQGRVVDAVAIAAFGGILIGLVVVRMTQLVRQIEERNSELARRDRAVRRILDTVHEGLLRVSEEGRLQDERSAVIDRWFRPALEGTLLADFFREYDAAFALHFELAFEALHDGVFPEEVCLAQLPTRLTARGRSYRVSYLPVRDDETADGLLVVIVDVTDELRRASEDAEQREVLAMLRAMIRDRDGFLSFFDEATRLVQDLGSPAVDPESVARALHTLKGNASMVEFHVIVRLCDEAESALANGDGTADAAMGSIRRRWLVLTDVLETFFGERGRRAVTIGAEDIERLCDDVGHGIPGAQIVERLTAWSNEPLERPLRRLADHARTLAARRGKGDLAVECTSQGVMVDRSRWAPLWSALIHVIRNAVDHGLETPAERRTAGKGSPRLRLSAELVGGSLLLEVEDDGRGIDWEAVRRSAQRRGLAASTEPELTAALLAGGVSARSRADSLSGRGVGLSAVAVCVESFGGKIELVSRANAGVRWRFLLPVSSGIHRAVRPAEERGRAS
jgi:HPt (histidine-containing phosphotransfer) domain-containing protein